MIDGHLTSPEFERFIHGERTSVDFETHVVACEVCARALAEEARLEIVLKALAQERRLRLAPVRRSRFRRNRGYLIGAALAAAASMFLIFHSIRALASIDRAALQASSGPEEIHGQPAAIVPDGGFAVPSALASLDAGRLLSAQSSITEQSL